MKSLPTFPRNDTTTPCVVCCETLDYRASLNQLPSNRIGSCQFFCLMLAFPQNSRAKPERVEPTEFDLKCRDSIPETGKEKQKRRE